MSKIKKIFCELVVIRHGQTVANAIGILQGQTNTELDATGIRQAEVVAERLRDEHFDAAYSSDLGRAFNTALAIASFHDNLEIIQTPALREWALGELEGLTFPILMEKYPDIMASFRRESENTLVPGGESQEEFQNRVGTFLDDIASKNQDKRVLVVTHGGVLQRIFRHAVGPTGKFNILSISGNTSINIFRNIDGAWQLVTWNDCAHLKHVGQKDTLAY